jgi:hypothetical protein
VTDRRAWDPFAPQPRPSHTPTPRQATTELPAGLDALRKPDLIALAAQHGLNTTGTRTDLITRLREATP